jgi:hypothetical protein
VDALGVVIALVGALAGAGGLILGVINFRHARPRIFVNTILRFGSDGPADEWIVIDIRNEGQYGTEIVGVGLAVCPPRSSRLGRVLDRWKWLRWRAARRRISRHGVSYNQFGVDSLDDGTEQDEQVFLEPGRHFRLQVAMTQAAAQTSGRQAWGYAEDIGGRLFLSDGPAAVQYR